MQWLMQTFLPYCEKQGYELIKDDIRFIENIMNKLPQDKRRPILFEYCKQWSRGMDSEKDTRRKQSAGRYNANQFLLNYLGKVTK